MVVVLVVTKIIQIMLVERMLWLTPVEVVVVHHQLIVTKQVEWAVLVSFSLHTLPK